MANIPFLNNAYFAAKVGIRTESPTGVLHIKTTDDSNFWLAKIEADGTTQNALLAITDTTSGTGVRFDLGGQTGSFTVLNSGNVGIGMTIPGAKLHVNSGLINTVALFESTDDKAFIRIKDDNTDVYLISKDSKFYIGSDSSSYQKFNVDISSGNVGIGSATPGAKLVVTDDNNGQDTTFRVNHTRSDSNVATQAIEVDMNLSGSDTTTADRTNSGIKIDLDSSADGDGLNEQRIYGVFSDVAFTGFSDLARGGFFKVESNNNTEKTSQMVGVYGQATHDSNNAAGGVSNMYGVYGIADIQDLGDVDNAFGGYFQVELGSLRGAADFGVTKGVEGHININKAATVSYNSMTAVSAVIDNNEGTAPNFNNQFLFKGDYQGDRGSDAYGIYCEGDKHYLEGKLAINLSTPTQVLHVAGNARVTGAYYDSNNSPGTANQVLVSTVTGTDWVDGSGSSIIGGPYLPLTAGSTKPLTGTLYGTSTNWSGSGDYAGSLTLGTGASTQEAHLQIGQGRTGNGFSYIDLIGDATYTDYGLRIIRSNTGPNTDSSIIHRGQGNLNIQTTDSASILLKTAGNEKMRITSAGNVGIGTTNPSHKLTISDTTAHTTARVLTTTFNANLRVSTNNSDFAIIGQGGSNRFDIFDVNADSTRVSINSSGNVGIGTITPDTALEVVNNVNNSSALATDVNAGIIIHNGDASGTAVLKLRGSGQDSGAVVFGAIAGAASDKFHIISRLNQAKRLTVQGDGNVGIGTTSPDNISSTGTVLSISTQGALTTNSLAGSLTFLTNDASFTNTYADGVTTQISSICESTTGAAYGLSFSTSTITSSNRAERLRITATGNVGIGTTTPTAPLHIEGGTNSEVLKIEADSNPFVRWVENGTDVGFLQFLGDNAYLSNMSNGSFFFRTNNTDKMTILAGGNVGIGTTSPGATLQVNGGTTFGASSPPASTSNFINNFNNNLAVLIKKISTGTGDYFSIQDSSSSSKFIVKSSGNVGIGTTSPTAKLHVVGTGLFTGLVSGITPVNAANFVTKAYVDGSGGGTGPFLPLAGGTMTGTNGVLMPDNFRLKFGDATTPDLQIYHDGSHSYINDSGVGALKILASQLEINNAANSENIATFTQDGAVSLYYNGSKKFETTNTGVTVTGSGIFTGNLNVNGNATLGDATTDDHVFNGQVTHVTADALGYKLYRSNGSTSMLISATGDSEIEFGTDNGSGTNTTQWTIGKDSTDNSFRISNSASLGTSDTLTLAGANATFAGTVTAGSYFLGDDTSISLATTGAGTVFLRPNGQSSTAQSSFTTTLATIGTSVAITGAATATTATTSTDNNATLTTKGYVDGLVTGVPVYRGTWDARNNTERGSGSDGGDPDLRLAANKILGNYYIVETAGSATPNGANTKPDSWNVGDWCIFSDVTSGAGTDLWQKIDNTSVISGAGTGQKVTKWEGTSGATSETLTDGPITFSTSNNDSTFAGNVTISNELTIAQNSASNRILFTRSGHDSFSLSLLGSQGLTITNVTDNRTDLQFSGSGKATFGGDVTLTNGQLTVTHDTNNVARIIQADTNLGNNSYTFEVDSSAQVSNMSVAGAMAVDVNSGRAFTITGAGNVGIGTASNTTHKLIVSGGSNIASFRSEGSGQNLKKLSISTGGDRVVLDASTTTDATTNFAFQTGGSERMRIASDGKVGIGVTAPTSTVHVDGLQTNSGSTSAHLPTGTMRLNFAGADGANDYGASLVFTQRWWTGSTGEVAMGQIAGVKETGSGNYGGGLAFFTSNNTSNNLLERLRINELGNVGIGTTDPNDALEVKGNNSTQHRIRINNTGTGTSTLAFVKDTTFKSWVEYDNSTGNFDVWQYTNNPLRFATNNTERIRITSNGNVGIGTTNPLDKLHVNGRVRTSTSGVVIGDTNAVIYRNSNDLELITYGGFDINLMPAGKVGIGTVVPDYKLDVRNGEFSVRPGSSGNGGLVKLGNSSSNAIIQLYDASGNEDVRISTSLSSYFNGGNVGIGTTSPGAKLHLVSSGSDFFPLRLNSSSAKTWQIGVGGTNYYDGQFLLQDSSVGERLRINSAGTFTLPAYNSTNQTGTPTYLLGTDASGNVVKTNSTPSPITSQAASLYDLIPNGAFTTTYAFTSTAGTYAEVMEGSDVITASGTYSVQMFVNDFAVGGTQYSETYSGIMSWASATNTNSGSGDGTISEIVLHRSGHATNTGMTYLRTRETTSANGGKLKLEIMGNLSYTGASNVVFKFVRLI